MRASIYYAIAILLTLATIPMYRYMYQRAMAAETPQVSELLPALPVDETLHRPLNDNERCYGGAVIVESGNSYTQLGTAQYPFRCAGRTVYDARAKTE